MTFSLVKQQEIIPKLSLSFITIHRQKGWWHIAISLYLSVPNLNFLCSWMCYFVNGLHRWEKKYRPIHQAATLTQLNKRAWFNTQYFGKTDSFFYQYISKRP